MYPYRLFTLDTEPLFHLRTEVSLVSGDYRDNLLDVFPDLLFQHNGTDIMPTALVLVCPMGGTDKEVLPLFKVACGRVIQLLLAVIAEHKAGETNAEAIVAKAIQQAIAGDARARDFVRDTIGEKPTDVIETREKTPEGMAEMYAWLGTLRTPN